MPLTDTAQHVYDLLMEHQGGLTRAELAAHSGLNDRTMRRTIEELRVHAATHNDPLLKRPIIIGYDPHLERYVAARTTQQAQRVTAYYRSYVNPMLQALSAQEKAIEHYRKTEATQDAMFTPPRGTDLRYTR